LRYQIRRNETGRTCSTHINIKKLINLIGKPQETDHTGNLGAHERIIMKLILIKYVVRV
jgi:hypothetical protein